MYVPTVNIRFQLDIEIHGMMSELPEPIVCTQHTHQGNVCLQLEIVDFRVKAMPQCCFKYTTIWTV